MASDSGHRNEVDAKPDPKVEMQVAIPLISEQLEEEEKTLIRLLIMITY